MCDSVWTLKLMKSPLLQQVVDSEGHMHIQSQKVPLGIQVAIDLSCCCGVSCPVQIDSATYITWKLLALFMSSGKAVDSDYEILCLDLAPWY